MELPHSACGCKKSALDVFDDHVSTCTVHSGSKKTHDWSVEQLPDLFHTTHRVKTQEVARSRGQRCGDIELAVYLTNAAGPVPLVLDLLITHEKFGSRSDPSINGHLHYPHDLDRSLNEDATDKIRQYRTDYNNRPSHAISFMPAIDSTSGCLHSEFVLLPFCYRIIGKPRETDRFLAASGVQLAQPTLHFRGTVFSSPFKFKVDHILTKATALWINLNIAGTPITSRSHTHPSHTQNSRLLTSFVSIRC